MPQVPWKWDDPQAKAVLKSNLMRNDFVAYVSSIELALKHALRLVAMSYEPSAIMGDALFT